MADIATPIFGFDNRIAPPNNPDNPDNKVKSNQPYILDLVTRERLFFQNIPLDLDYDPQSNFVAIASAGRNNPLYHYVGSEDVLKFQLSWYANTAAKDDVIKKCKWIESLSKNNGYDEKPHIVQCCFGVLFREAKWIVSSAPYKLSLFDRPVGLLPKLAIQEVCLRRTTETNRTRTEILNIYT